MGITGLWAHLKGRGCVKPLEEVELMRHVDGKVIAIDASTWVVQSQTEDASGYDHPLRHVKTFFERAGHYLRLGALPVLVFDGQPPPQKAETFVKRYGYEPKRFGQAYNSAFREMMKDAKELLEAMGVPVVQAEGEAEAACALLNRLGKVDAVASDDGDALLFGARRLYKALRLHVDLNSSSHQGEWVDHAAVAAALGLEGKGSIGEAMTAVALISGADYLVNGIPNFGPATAAEVVQGLRRKQQQREVEGGGVVELRLLDLLREALSTPADEALLETASACSTCQRCRHGTVRKAKHGTQGCVECETHPRSKGGSGEGGCNAAANVDEPCPCEPCQRKDDRLLHSLAKAAAANDGIRAYLARFDKARRAYEHGLNDSAAAAAGPFKWERPNYELLRPLLERVYGSSGKVPRKILPLIFEYDARYVGSVVGADMTVFGSADLDEAETLGFMLVPTAVLRPSGRSGGRGRRYEMRVQPIGEGIQILAAAARDEGVPMPPTPRQSCSAEEKERYRNELADVAKKVMSEGRATLRMSLVDSQYGALVSAYQAELARKRQPPPTPKKGKAAVSRTGAGAGGARAITTFFSKSDSSSSPSSSSLSSSSSSSSASSSVASSAEARGGVLRTPLAKAAASAAASAARARSPSSGSSMSSIEVINIPNSPPSPFAASPPSVAAASAADAKASTPFTPAKPPRPSTRTPSAPKKGKRPVLLPDEEEDVFGAAGGVRNLNPLFKRQRFGASDDDEGAGDEGGNHEISTIDLSTSLSDIAEEAGGGGRTEAAAVARVEVEVDDEVEIVEEGFSLARGASPRAARGRRRDRAPAVETVDLTNS